MAMTKLDPITRDSLREVRTAIRQGRLNRAALAALVSQLMELKASGVPRGSLRKAVDKTLGLARSVPAGDR
jgi:hypothetical protein